MEVKMKRLLTQLARVSLGAVLLLLFSGQYIYAASPSHQLAKKVEKALGHYYLEPFSITATDNGVVKIRGEVPVLYDRLRVFDIVAQVNGVREIKDEIVVKAPLVADNMIKAGIVEKIAVHSAISDPERIKVNVDNGVVILKGQVGSYREKLIINTIASWEKGVKGIEDEIQLVGAKTTKSDQELSAELQDILSDRFPHETNVTASVHEGVVTLAGSSQTLWTEDRLVEEISGVIGVQKIINTLKLTE
jgi:osmotically-inducible protein OsmY